MRQATRFLPRAGQTLEACCSSVGIRNEAAHTAVADARATAQLLRHYLRGLTWRQVTRRFAGRIQARQKSQPAFGVSRQQLSATQTQWVAERPNNSLAWNRFKEQSSISLWLIGYLKTGACRPLKSGNSLGSRMTAA